MTKKLTPAQQLQRLERWRHIREISDLGRRFKRTGPIFSGDDLSKQTFTPLDQSQPDADIRELKAAIEGTAAVLPRPVFARAFFDGVDAVGDPRKREILTLLAQMEEVLRRPFERQQHP